GWRGWFGWTQSWAGAVWGLLRGEAAPKLPVMRLGWEDPRLAFVVREPFRSKWSGVKVAAGLVEGGEELRLESHMPEGGVIFSDGVEADALAFNAGSAAAVRAAGRRARLVAGGGAGAPAPATLARCGAPCG